jgi:hypothetical protein
MVIFGAPEVAVTVSIMVETKALGAPRKRGSRAAGAGNVALGGHRMRERATQLSAQRSGAWGAS